MDALEFNDLLARVRAGGFDDAAEAMLKKRNSELVDGDYFRHVRSGDRYVLVEVRASMYEGKQIMALLTKA